MLKLLAVSRMSMPPALFSIVLSMVMVAVIAQTCPYGKKAVVNDSGGFVCERACAKGYYSYNGVYPCRPCAAEETIDGIGATSCELRSADHSSDNSESNDLKTCPEGTEYVEDSTSKGCRPLCSIGSYSDTGAAPCKLCQSGTTTTTPGSSECVPRTDERKACPEGQTLVPYGRMERCMPECKVGEYSRTGAIPCKNCMVGYTTDGTGATSCISNSDGDSASANCPQGTSYQEDEYGKGCLCVSLVFIVLVVRCPASDAPLDPVPRTLVKRRASQTPKTKVVRMEL